MNLKKQAANRLIFVLSFFFIAGCKPGNQKWSCVIKTATYNKTSQKNMALRRYQKAILLIKDLCSNSAVAGYHRVRRDLPVGNELGVAYTADMQPVDLIGVVTCIRVLAWFIWP